MKDKTISPEVKEILARCRLEDKTLFLPLGQLDRKLYVDVNEALVSIGYKWNKKQKCHILDDPQTNGRKLADVLNEGKILDSNPLDFYSTSKEVYEQIKPYINNWIAGRRDISFLEPSAGIGDLAVFVMDDFREIGKFLLVEKDENRFNILDKRMRQWGAKKDMETGFICRDFLEITRKFEIIIMNPPFTADGDGQAWATHTNKALDLLSPGGLLISIVPRSIEYVKFKKVKSLKERLEAEGNTSIIRLPDDSFEDVGTKVSTNFIVFKKSEEKRD